MNKVNKHDVFVFDESHGGSRIQSVLNLVSREYNGILTMSNIQAYCNTNNIKLSEAEIEYLEGFFTRSARKSEDFTSNEDELSL